VFYFFEGQGREQGFLSGFCDVAKSGDHPENNLAKFGYILDMKSREKKIQNPSILLVTYWNLS
jgi:hypothetical protein